MPTGEGTVTEMQIFLGPETPVEVIGVLSISSRAYNLRQAMFNVGDTVRSSRYGQAGSGPAIFIEPSIGEKSVMSFT